MGKFGSGNTNPLPVALPAECRKATKLFSAFVDPLNGLDKVIPAQILRKAKGFAFLTVAKAGFVFSARAGTGVVIARLSDGNWSAPSAIGTAGFGAGLQVGAEITDFLILLNSRAAVQSFMASGSLTLGGNMSVAAGPLGRNVEGNGTLSSKGGLAAMYSYSRTKGLFGGASIEGSVIVERSDANAKAYGFSVTAKQLLSGAVKVPEFADQLIETISRRSGNSSNWAGEEDRDGDDGDQFEEDNDDGGGRRSRKSSGAERRPDISKGYSFGSPFAAGGADTPPTAGNGYGDLDGEKERGDKKVGKFSNIVGASIGRARSGSLAALGGRPRSGSVSANNSAGPAYTNGYKFDQSFDNGGLEENDEEKPKKFDHTPSSTTSSPFSQSTSGRSRASSTPSGFKDQFDRDGLIEEKFESPHEDIFGFGRNRAASSASTSSFGRAKLTKQKGYSSPSRSYGTGSTRAWDTPSTGRDSFESLDDEDPRSRYNRGYQGGDDRGETWEKRKPVQRFPSATSTSTYSNKKASPFSDEFAAPPSSSSSSVERPNLGPPTKSYQTRPWDSDDEDLMAFSNASKASTPSSNRDPYDLGQMGDSLSRPGAGTRSRSSTVGKGLGSAVALFDFSSNEPGDLSFKKGEVITILKQDDEEWWTGRIALREGILPRNYVEFERGIWV